MVEVTPEASRVCTHVCMLVEPRNIGQQHGISEGYFHGSLSRRRIRRLITKKFSVTRWWNCVTAGSNTEKNFLFGVRARSP